MHQFNHIMVITSMLTILAHEYIKSLDICIIVFVQQDRHNNMIRKARNHCQDVDNCGDEDHCRYHLGIDHCQTGNRCQDR